MKNNNNIIRHAKCELAISKACLGFSDKLALNYAIAHLKNALVLKMLYSAELPVVYPVENNELDVIIALLDANDFILPKWISGSAREISEISKMHSTNSGALITEEKLQVLIAATARFIQGDLKKSGGNSDETHTFD